MIIKMVTLKLLVNLSIYINNTHKFLKKFRNWYTFKSGKSLQFVNTVKFGYNEHEETSAFAHQSRNSHNKWVHGQFIYSVWK